VRGALCFYEQGSVWRWLLCGHHYRVSRRALHAAGALVLPLPGKADAADAAFLEGDHQQQHVEIIGL